MPFFTLNNKREIIYEYYIYRELT